MMHIALEGGCFVLSANQCCRGRDCPVPPGNSDSDTSFDEITSPGGSFIVSPSGSILAGPNYQGECLISADLGMKAILIIQSHFPAVNINTSTLFSRCSDHFLNTIPDLAEIARGKTEFSRVGNNLKP